MHDLTALSKFLSLILRHDPGKIGLVLDEEGWADINQLIQLAKQNGKQLTRTLLNQIVAENSKKRFTVSEDGDRIRANQGHSIPVDLGLSPTEPPHWLHHGTASRFLPSIQSQGLVPGKRQHVHLSSDIETAMLVGKRHGRPVVLTVQSGKLHRDGYTFVLSANGVWLTEMVPAAYIIFPDPDKA